MEEKRSKQHAERRRKLDAELADRQRDIEAREQTLSEKEKELAEKIQTHEKKLRSFQLLILRSRLSTMSLEKLRGSPTRLLLAPFSSSGLVS
jgi:hypothetical protein